MLRESIISKVHQKLFWIVLSTNLHRFHFLNDDDKKAKTTNMYNYKISDEISEQLWLKCISSFIEKFS